MNIRGRVLSLPTGAYTRLGGQIVGVSVLEITTSAAQNQEVRGNQYQPARKVEDMSKSDTTSTRPKIESHNTRDEMAKELKKQNLITPK